MDNDQHNCNKFLWITMKLVNLLKKLRIIVLWNYPEVYGQFGSWFGSLACCSSCCWFGLSTAVVCDAAVGWFKIRMDTWFP